MTAQYDPKGGPMVYATFNPPTVPVKNRQVSLSAWIYAWAAGGLIVGPIIGLVILFVMCHGVHR